MNAAHIWRVASRRDHAATECRLSDVPAVKRARETERLEKAPWASPVTPSHLVVTEGPGRGIIPREQTRHVTELDGLTP